MVPLMCGRFSANFDLSESRIRWDIHSDFSLFAPRFNVAPSQDVAVIVNDHGTRAVKLMQWGLVPSWTKDQGIGNQLINARAETLRDKASFKGLVETRRCLIPANGFYEWRKEGKRKVPMWFYLKGKELFAFARRGRFSRLKPLDRTLFRQNLAIALRLLVARLRAFGREPDVRGRWVRLL